MSEILNLEAIRMFSPIFWKADELSPKSWEACELNPKYWHFSEEPKYFCFSFYYSGYLFIIRPFFKIKSHLNLRWVNQSSLTGSIKKYLYLQNRFTIEIYDAKNLMVYICYHKF